MDRWRCRHLARRSGFLIWGPLGGGSPPGNGPLFMGSYGLDGGPGDGREQIGIIIPILSSSHSTVVIDGIQLVGGAGYPAPRPFALRVIDYNQCAGAWPLRRTRRGLVLDGCNAYDLGPLVGHQVHWSGGEQQSEAVAEVSPPGPRSCWVLTALVVRYHVGSVRYRGTYPDAMVTCRGLAQSREWAVMEQAAAERPGS
ncbi:MAG TPA: hypothetical protein VF940_14785 [Streptosporangiaceae bacterium]